MVTKLDRLGRSLVNLIELSRELQERGVGLVVLDQGIDTTTAVGRMFFQILGAIAELVRRGLAGAQGAAGEVEQQLAIGERTGGRHRASGLTELLA